MTKPKSKTAVRLPRDLIPRFRMTDSTQKKINDRSAKITCVETVAGKVRYNEDKAAENGSLIVEDGVIFTPEGLPREQRARHI